MVASAPDETRLLAFLIVVGAVGMAVVGIFLGIGFLLLGPGHPAIAPAGLNVPGDAVEAHEVLPSTSEDRPGSSGPTPLDNKIAGSASSGMPGNQETLLWRAMATEIKLAPPARIAHAKSAGANRHHHQRTANPWQTTASHWPALWRPDARAGPEPGGGFYHAKNFDVGHVNPER